MRALPPTLGHRPRLAAVGLHVALGYFLGRLQAPLTQALGLALLSDDQHAARIGELEAVVEPQPEVGLEAGQPDHVATGTGEARRAPLHRSLEAARQHQGPQGL